jgi:hypothetical protein
MSLEALLKQEIKKELIMCCPRSLPSLNRHIQSPAAQESIAAQILSMCESEGVSVQVAMAQIDSDLD